MSDSIFEDLKVWRINPIKQHEMTGIKTIFFKYNSVKNINSDRTKRIQSLFTNHFG